MANQGLIAVVENNVVVMKIITGMDGQNIRLVTKELHKKWPMTISEVYELALSKCFGATDSLVVMIDGQFIYEGDDDVSDLYFQTFSQPNFNPRWENGTADFTEIVEVGK